MLYLTHNSAYDASLSLGTFSVTVPPSLPQHKQKEELEAIESRFQEKKRKFLEDSEKFRRDLKKVK